MSSHSYVCDGCGRQETFTYEGVRIPYPCHICNDTTCWTRSDQVQTEGSA